MFWIAFAIVFLVALFLSKNTSFIKNKTNSELNNENNGLTYNNAVIGALVNKDTDQDGIPDWEESLWGTDPTKKETNPGTPDSVTIEKLKAAEGNAAQIPEDDSKLTKTDEFSRELFSTVASLNESGSLDQATVDKIGSSLAEQMQNSAQRKIYTISDIKIIKDNSVKAFTNYNIATGALLYKKYPVNDSIINILEKSLINNGDINTDELAKLDPIIEQINKIISGMLAVPTPSELSSLHLEFINELQKITENLNDIKQVENDPVVAMGAINQYAKNNDGVELAINNLAAAINKKLNK